MLVSLHNFISVVFQSIATPTLLSYEEELIRLNTLQEENDLLKVKVASLGGEGESSKKDNDPENQDLPAPAELMDDFYVIAQEPPSENVSRSIKSLIKNISSGLPASPILGRHLHEGKRPEENISTSSLKFAKPKPRSPSVPPQPSSHGSASESSSHALKQEPSSSKSVTVKKDIVDAEVKTAVMSKHPMISHSSHHSSMPLLTDPKSGFLILSQEDYAEHNSFVTCCLFNSSGTMVASSDIDGVVKIWDSCPILTQSTIMSKNGVYALEWAPKREKLLFHGSVAGKARLYDAKERRIIGEAVSSLKPSENQRVLCIACNPTEANFAVSVQAESEGNIALYDMRTMQLQCGLPRTFDNSYCCCSFNHNGQLLLVGSQDGRAQIYDLRNCESIADWTAHSSIILSMQWSSDENSCYTMGQDGKFFQWSINQTGYQLGELPIHGGATGVYSKLNQPAGKLFAFNTDSTHMLTCGPIGGIIYKVNGSNLDHSLNIGGHPVTTVDWSTAMECSTCLCGSANGKITVTTLMTQ